MNETNLQEMLTLQISSLYIISERDHAIKNSEATFVSPLLRGHNHYATQSRITTHSNPRKEKGMGQVYFHDQR